MRRQLMSPACTAANYIKVHAFLARGTCLFFPPCLSCFLVSPFFSLLPPPFPVFLPSRCPLLSCLVHLYHSPVVARIISPVKYYIRPRLRARSFGIKRHIIVMHHYRSEREIPYLYAPRRFAEEFARVGERFCVFTRVF